MKNLVTLIICAFFLSAIISCISDKNQSPEDIIKQTLNKKVDLNMFEKLYHQDTQVYLSDVRKSYDFVSLVYLKDNCEPCIPKYIEWHHRLDAMNLPDNYTVLFIIEGNNLSSYENFMAEARKQDAFNERFYTVFDASFSFLEANRHIPYNLIESSLLLDDKNRIKLIGSPFISEGMSNLFFSIIKT